jgi:hypothetical protein
MGWKTNDEARAANGDGQGWTGGATSPVPTSSDESGSERLTLRMTTRCLRQCVLSIDDALCLGRQHRPW